MAAGLRIKGASGVTQIDNNYANDGLVATGTVAMTLDPTPRPNQMRIGSVTIAGNQPVIAFAAAQQEVNLVGTSQSGGNWTFHFRARSDADFNLSWWVFDVASSALGASNPTGIRIKDDFGVTTFHGGLRPLRVVGFTGSGGTYTAGRTYAVIQSSQRLQFNNYDEPMPSVIPGPGNKIQRKTSWHAAAMVNGNSISCGLRQFEDFEAEVPGSTPDLFADEGNTGWLVVDVTDYGTVDLSDYTLNPVNWSNASPTTTSNNLDYTSAYVPMQGIAQQVTLRASYQASKVGNLENLQVTVVSNTRGEIGSITQSSAGGDPSGNFTVNPNEQIAFRVRASTSTGIRTGTVDMRVLNISDGGYQIDTVTYSCTVDSDNNYNIADLVPNALNWANVTVNATGTFGSGINGNQTISGINRTVTLRATISNYSGNVDTAQFFIDKNEGTNAGGTSAAGGGGSFDFSVVNGDRIYFYADASSAAGTRTFSYTVTITNQSAGGTVLDTFTVSGTIDAPDLSVTPIAIGTQSFTSTEQYNGVTSPAYTVQGTNRDVTLRITLTNVVENMDDGNFYFLKVGDHENLTYRRQIQYSNGGRTADVTVPPGFQFQFVFDGLTTSRRQTADFNVAITNLSDGGATVASFVCSGVVDSDDNFNVPDFTPNAVNWTNISFSTTASSGTGNNYATRQTITGINRTVTLRATVSGYSGDVSAAELRVMKNSGGAGIAYMPNGSVDFTVVNGDVIHFDSFASTSFGVRSHSYTVTITNVSTGAVLDTFTVAGTVDSDDDHAIDRSLKAIDLPNMAINTPNDTQLIYSPVYRFEGINRPVDLSIAVSQLTGNLAGGTVYFLYEGDHGNLTYRREISWTGTTFLTDSSVDVTVPPDFDFRFALYAATDSGMRSSSATVTINNQTPGWEAFVDSFTVSATVDNDNNYNIPDFTPDAVTWPNVTWSTNSHEVYGAYNSNGPTLTGFNRTIALRVECIANSSNTTSRQLQITNHAHGVYANINNYQVGSFVDFNVDPGANFLMKIDATTNSGIRQTAATWRVYNLTTGANIGEFTTNVIVDADNNYNLDYTPDAINIPNRSFSTNANQGAVNTEWYAITGINGPITIRVSVSGYSGNLTNTGIYIQKNYATVTTSPTWLPWNSTGTIEATFVNGDVINLYCDASTSSGVRSGSCTVTLTNVTTGAVIDTFVLSGTVDADNNFNVTDVVPDAFNVPNLSLTTNEHFGNATAHFQQITGINQPITLRFQRDQEAVSGNMYVRDLYVYKSTTGSGGPWTGYTVTANGSVDVTFNNGDWFYVHSGFITNSGRATASYRTTIRNQTTGGTSLDTFTTSATVDNNNDYNVPDYSPTYMNIPNLSSSQSNVNGHNFPYTSPYYVNGTNQPITLRFWHGIYYHNLTSVTGPASAFVHLQVIKNGQAINGGGINLSGNYSGGEKQHYQDVTFNPGDGFQWLFAHYTYPHSGVANTQPGPDPRTVSHIVANAYIQVVQTGEFCASFTTDVYTEVP